MLFALLLGDSNGGKLSVLRGCSRVNLMSRCCRITGKVRSVNKMIETKIDIYVIYGRIIQFWLPQFNEYYDIYLFFSDMTKTFEYTCNMYIYIYIHTWFIFWIRWQVLINPAWNYRIHTFFLKITTSHYFSGFLKNISSQTCATTSLGRPGRSVPASNAHGQREMDVMIPRNRRMPSNALKLGQWSVWMEYFLVLEGHYQILMLFCKTNSSITVNKVTAFVLKGAVGYFFTSFKVISNHIFVVGDWNQCWYCINFIVWMLVALFP